MNIAYKHLEDKLRIGELSFGQWAAVLVGVAMAIAWGYLSPFGTLVTLSTGVYFVALPVFAAYLASVTDFDLIGTLIAGLRWARSDGLYLPGPGPDSPGYRLTRDPNEDQTASRTTSALEVEELWRS